YLNKCIIPHTDKLHAISNAINSPCKVDLNFTLFDVLSRVSLGGIWLSWELRRKYEIHNEVCEKTIEEIQQYSTCVKQLITNNPILFSPYKDDQAIDISIALYFLSLEHSNVESMETWVSELLHRVRFSFNTHGNYPCTLSSYHELLEHPASQDDDYREEITSGSILYPVIALFSGLYKLDDTYKEVQNFKEESLKHTNFQFWFPDTASEDLFYNNKESHGATLSSLPIEKGPEDFLEHIFGECDKSSSYRTLSAVVYGVEPLILVACRLYRLPMPIHMLEAHYHLFLECEKEGLNE
ncbi:MAG: hypothetical protein RPR97_18765, partial [Colwellia sp.]